MTTLIERLEPEEDRLHNMRQRLVALRAFERTMQELTRGKPFEIKNDLIWITLIDSRDAVFIHFASWAKALCAHGGFFGQLKAHHLRELDVRDREGKYVLQEAERGRRKRIDARLPGARARRRVIPADVDALKGHFRALALPVIDDRDTNRAHPFGEDHVGNVAMLRLDQLEPVFAEAESILNDIRLMCADSSRNYHDHFSIADPDGTAGDLVDLVLFGGMLQLEQLFGVNEALKKHTGQWAWQHREAFYERVHQRHDQDQGDRFFNDSEALLRALDLE